MFFPCKALFLYFQPRPGATTQRHILFVRGKNADSPGPLFWGFCLQRRIRSYGDIRDLMCIVLPPPSSIRDEVQGGSLYKICPQHLLYVVQMMRAIYFLLILCNTQKGSLNKQLFLGILFVTHYTSKWVKSVLKRGLMLLLLLQLLHALSEEAKGCFV